MMTTPSDFALAGPEIFLLCAIGALVFLDLFLPKSRQGLVHVFALLSLVFAGILTFRHGGLGLTESHSAFAGSFVRDGVGDVLKLFVYLVSGAAMIYGRTYLKERDILKGEYYLLLMCAVLGMMVLISAGSLLTVYLGLELLALPSYALVAMDRDNGKASESAMKYFVLGAIASGMLLYGMSMIFGATGSLLLTDVHAAIASVGDMEQGWLLLGLVFLIAGLAFKLGAAPFHMWLPDVYQGTPVGITLFIASAPKLAAFGMAYRLLHDGTGGLVDQWGLIIAWLAVASLAIGNVIAIAQTSIRRMFAYSTVGHIGFLLVGFSTGTDQAYAASMFYAIAYSLMAVGGFAVIAYLSAEGFELDDIDDLRGLNQQRPWLALVMLLLIASMAGVPPLLGFWAKLSVWDAAIQGGRVWLAIVSAVFAVIGAFYYLRILKVMYFDEADEKNPLAIIQDPMARTLLIVNGALMLVLGIFWNPLMSWCQTVMAS